LKKRKNLAWGEGRKAICDDLPTLGTFKKWKFRNRKQKKSTQLRQSPSKICSPEDQNGKSVAAIKGQLTPFVGGKKGENIRRKGARGGRLCKRL